jgi:hypothetical protein
MSMSSIARKRRSEVQIQSQAPVYNPNIQQTQQQMQPQQMQQQMQQQQQQQQQQQKPMGTGLTLPQVISVIDNRLIHLENFMKETNSAEKSDYAPSEISPEFVEEVQTRFDILAREISDLKDVVLKLQSFTMDVNKSLLEERIHILSDLGENKNMVEDI